MNAKTYCIYPISSEQFVHAEATAISMMHGKLYDETLAFPQLFFGMRVKLEKIQGTQVIF